MRPFLTLALVALAAVPSVLAAPASQTVSKTARCGASFGELTCRGSSFGNCCSRYGYCGSTDTYCGNGCQTGYGSCSSNTSPPPTVKVSKDGQCGSKAGTTCKGSAFGDCCSSYGWCGSSNAYCRSGCNPLYGTCKESPAPSPTSSALPSATNNVSKNARCGYSYDAFPQGMTCRGSKWGNCCSQYGYCGSTGDYCEKGCQPGFGDCKLAASSKQSSISLVLSTSSVAPSSTHESSSMVSSSSYPSSSPTSSSGIISTVSSNVVSSTSSVVSSSVMESSTVVSASASSMISSSVSSSAVSSSVSSSAVSSSMSSSAVSSSMSPSASPEPSSTSSSQASSSSPTPTPNPLVPFCARDNVQLPLKCGTGSFTVGGNLQILDSATSAVLGYLNNNPAQSGGYMFNVDTNVANALVITFPYSSPDCTTNPTDLAFTMQNSVKTDGGSYLGLVGGSGGYTAMGPGHVDYAYTGPVSYVAPDTKAQTVTTGASTLGYTAGAETSIWNLDLSCGDVTATWTNDDNTQIIPTMFLDYALCASGCILQGGDQAKFAATFPGENIQAVKLKFVPIL